MDLQGKTVLIVGAGKSGIAAGELLRKKGIAYRLYDGNKELSKEELQKNDIWKDCGIILGELPTEILADTGLAVLSPGVPTDLPVIAAIREQGIPIWGEIELAYHFAKGRLLAITGTNGKTTTTSLLGEIMQAYFEDVKVVGNIGIPYTSVAADTTDETVTVAEISSFQLETAVDFHPQVSAILNITPDHLNRHHTMECYIETKESITKNQQKEDVCVLNYEDEVLLEFGKSIPIRVVFFSSKRRLEDGFFYEDGVIYKSTGGKAKKIIETVKKNGSRVSGPVPLPTKKEVVTILRAVHKYKDSREQFEQRTHKRLIDITAPTQKTVDALSRLEMPAGVHIDIKMKAK